MFNLQALLEQGDRTGLHTDGRSLDIPLARKTFEFIEAHPEEWEQSEWICETGMCYAGHAAHIAGADLAEPSFAAKAWGPDGDGIHISDYAQTVLGLGDGEATRMFFSENSLADLRGMVDDLETKGHLAAWGVLYYEDGMSEWDGP
jgi:hypothetical protein